jgi:MazG family protein
MSEELDIAFHALGDTPYLRLKNLMAKLRAPDGCPWDREQDFADIARYTIEEAYEVADAIAQNDMTHLREELGDLLFQTVFHSRIAEEAGHFSLDDVSDDLVRKMVRRHPHVFGDGHKRNAEEQVLEWEEVKAQERAAKGETERENKSLLDDVALALPALMRAEKLQKRAARVGFDWPNLDGVIDKIVEEAQEVAEAAESQDPDSIEDEMGDLLFAVTNLARKLGVDPEVALRRTNDKFTRRFKSVEVDAKTVGKALPEMSLEEMDALWNAAKRAERG